MRSLISVPIGLAVLVAALACTRTGIAGPSTPSVNWGTLMPTPVPPKPLSDLGFAPMSPENAGSVDAVRRLTGHRHVVDGLAFAADGRVLASASPDTTLHAWD